jgi:hypothetical protein
MMKMKNVNLYMRRIHLYLSMALIPWFLMYGISSFVFNHKPYINSLYGSGQPERSVRFDVEYSHDFPADMELRDIGHEIINSHDLPFQTFSVSRPRANQIIVYMRNFWSSARVTYFIDEHRLLAEDTGFRVDTFLTGMHARGGYHQDTFLNDMWALMVDVFCLSMLVWIITGMYMWWMLKGVRMWGAVAVVGGIVTFTVFVLLL